jgi:spermidine/putrescine transport system ATP-binding protein
LDFKLRLQMRSELRELQRRLGKTSIYVTHDQTEALALSDRIAVLSQGRIEQIGRPVDIYEAPETAFVADFIGNSNMMEVSVEAKTRSGTVMRAKSGLQVTGPVISEGIGSSLRVLVRPEHIRLRDASEDDIPNCMTAEIVDFTYLGEDVHLRVTIAGGGELLVALKSGRATRNLERGRSIQLAIDPSDVHVLRK